MTHDNQDPMRIIVLVEDSEEDYEAITRAFKKVDLTNPVFWCKSGEEVLDFLKRRSTDNGYHKLLTPGLILLDLNMPGLNGHHTLQAIKEDPLLKGIPVVIFTTSSNERDVQKCYQMGANAYIPKPRSFKGMVVVAESIKDYWFKSSLLPQATGAPE
jgi:two-component system response regulator